MDRVLHQFVHSSAPNAVIIMRQTERERIALPADGIQASDDSILLKEVERAVGKLKMRKSPGTDSVSAELLKAGGEKLARQVHNICAQIWISET